MSTVNSVVSSDSDYLKVQDAVKSQSELDKDAFINLLVTQMKYQDPLEPMDNSEMLAQLAQFTALEQMLNVAQTGQKQLANSMIGKYVEYQYTDSSTGQTSYLVGKVDYVTITGDTPKLGIGNVEVTLDEVYQVVDSSNIQTNTTAFELINKTVQATMKEKNAEGKEESVIIEGEVLGIQMEDGNPYIIIGTGKEKVTIDFKDVQNIVEKPSIIGKKVTATYTNSEGEKVTVEGKAEYIKIKSSGTYVYVDGKFVNFDDIQTVE
nr:flagellar hook capping FlgD N-terminal domain-containing protein [uncultured Cellulosilyticum sp.]